MKFNHPQMYITLIFTLISTIAFSPTSLAMETGDKLKAGVHLASSQMRDPDSNMIDSETGGIGTTVNQGPCYSKEETGQNISDNLPYSDILYTHAAQPGDSSGTMDFLKSKAHHVPLLQLPQSPHSSSPGGESQHVTREAEILDDRIVQHLDFRHSQDLSSKFVFITGITSGIGLELTNRLLRKGIHVIGVGRRQEALGDLKKKNIEDKLSSPRIGNLYTILADLSTNEGQDSVVPAVQYYLGDDQKLDYVVFNAATITPVGFEAIFNEPGDTIRKTINTNLTANVVLTGALCPLYRENARLLYVSSIAGKRPGGGTLLYSITKAALDQFVRCLRRDCALRKENPLPEESSLGHNPWEMQAILIAGINPGNVETPIHGRDLRGADPILFPRTEFFKGMKNKLTPPETSAEFMDWLLTTATVSQYLQNEEHNIYDPEQQKLWSSKPIIDPYPSPQTVKSVLLPSVQYPHAVVGTPLSVDSVPVSPTIDANQYLRESMDLGKDVKRVLSNIIPLVEDNPLELDK